jgi:peroxiredoxin
VSHILENISVLDQDGRAVRLGSVWETRPIVLVFVRHFACLFCRQQVAQLRASIDRIHDLGAELVVIGNGTPEQARTFREEQRLDTPLYTDPERNAYRALEMRHGRKTVTHPRVMLHAIKALLQGFRQTSVAGDPLQQGGVLVIEPGGVERYRYISREAGDHPSPDAILASLQP